MELMHSAEEILQIVIEFGILLLESSGVCVLLCAAVKGILGWVKKDINVRLMLAQGIALALEFKLGGEVLRTVIVREWSELMILGAIIVLRGALTCLIHWEIRHEEERPVPALSQRDSHSGSAEAAGECIEKL